MIIGAAKDKVCRGDHARHIEDAVESAQVSRADIPGAMAVFPGEVHDFRVFLDLDHPRLSGFVWRNIRDEAKRAGGESDVSRSSNSSIGSPAPST